MKFKKWLGVLVLSIAFGVISCLLVLHSSRINMLNGPCVPLDYPGAKRTVDQTIFEGNISMEVVLDFYNENLDALFAYNPNIESDSRWFLERLSENRVLYECIGGEGNRLDYAVGCINIIDHVTTVTIETFYFRSEDASCEVVDFDISSP